MSAVKTFLFIWMLYFGLILLNPVQSSGTGGAAALLLQLGFISLVTIWWCTWTLVRGKSVALRQSEDVNLRVLKRTVFFGLLFSFIGTLAIVFDRVIVQGIDYASGMAVARQEWRKASEAREGISSVWSILGYLFSTSFVAAIWPLVHFYEHLSRKYVARTLLVVFALLMANSFLTGGRSIILLTVAFAAGFYCIRRMRGFSKIRLAGINRRRLLLVVVSMFFFVNYVFYARAVSTGVPGFEYMSRMLAYLGAEPTPVLEFVHDNYKSFADVLAYNVLVVTYLTHSFYTTAAIIDVGGGDGFILFGYIKQLLAKIHLLGDANNQWFLAGRFPSVPGALYHDGRLILLVVGSMFLGLLAGVATFIARRVRPSVIIDGFAASVFVIMFLTPFVLAVDVLSFPFILFEFIFIGVLAKIRIGIRR